MSVFPMSSDMNVHLYEDALIEFSIDEASGKAVVTVSDRKIAGLTSVRFFVDEASLRRLVEVADAAESALTRAVSRQKALNEMNYVRTDSGAPAAV